MCHLKIFSLVQRSRSCGLEELSLDNRLVYISLSILNIIFSATRPLLRQIENLQSTFNAQSSTWEKVEKNLSDRLCRFYCFLYWYWDRLFSKNPPGWLSGERVGLMTWWLWVRSQVEATFLSGVFSPLTSAEACEKSSRWLWKKSSVSTGVRKPGNTYASPTAMIWP